MRIQCIHGYFKFFESDAGDLSRFMNIFGIELARSGDHFTFKNLVDAPDFSIAGAQFMGINAASTFEGAPWEVFRANGFVYDFASGSVVPIGSVSDRAILSSSGFFYMATGMIKPGSVMDDGERVTDYAAHFSFNMLNFEYSEVSVE